MASIAHMGKGEDVLRWGGLAGMLGGVVFLLSAVVLASSSFSTAPADPGALIAKFPEIRTTVAVAEVLYLVAAILWAFLFLSLYRSLRETTPAPAIFGSVIGVLGLAMLFAGALTFVAFDPISSLYNAAGATPATQATLVLLWQATQGIFNETDTVGFVAMSLAFVVLGVGMLRTTGSGKGSGGVSVVLGAVGLAGIALFSVTSTTFAIFGIVVFVILPVLLGWKVFRQSRAP